MSDVTRAEVCAVAIAEAFRGDGEILVAAQGRSVRLFDARSGHERLTIEAARVIQDLAFSPDGRRLVGADVNAVTLWDVATGRKAIVLDYTGLPPDQDTTPPDGVGGGGDDGGGGDAGVAPTTP